MSYILDALKKAERERGIAQVPNLSTVHNSHETPRNRSWVVPAAVTIIVVAGLGLLLYMWNQGNRPVSESHDYAVQQQDPGPAPTTKASAESSSAADLPAQSRKIDSNSLPVRKPATERMNSGIAASTKAAAGISRIPDEEIQSPPLPDQKIPQADIVGSAESSPVRDAGQDSSIPSADNVLPDPRPPLSDIPARTSVLQEAMKSMNISILLYAENPADRLVFINGRKYVEGDYIDGLYLVESITQDGAVLRYEAEQAVLKPATN